MNKINWSVFGAVMVMAMSFTLLSQNSRVTSNMSSSTALQTAHVSQNQPLALHIAGFSVRPEAFRGCINNTSCLPNEQCVNNTCQPISGGFGCSSDHDCSFPAKCINRVCQ